MGNRELIKSPSVIICCVWYRAWLRSSYTDSSNCSEIFLSLPIFCFMRRFWLDLLFVWLCAVQRIVIKIQIISIKPYIVNIWSLQFINVTNTRMIFFRLQHFFAFRVLFYISPWTFSILKPNFLLGLRLFVA